VKNRIKIMKRILRLPQFTNNCIPTKELKLMIVWVDLNYEKYWKNQ